MNQIDWLTELPQIIKAAQLRSLDPQFLRAIRQQEHGGESRYFGIIEAGVDSWQEQLNACANTVAHRLELYPANPLQRCFNANNQVRLRYTPSFIAYFSSHYAPIGADNDPTGMNKSWYSNVLSLYQSYVMEELNGVTGSSPS